MKQILILIVTVFAALPLRAQYEYTLQQCLEKGLLNNYSLRISRNEEQISKNNATLGNAGYLPTVDFTAGYTGDLNSSDSKLRADGSTASERNVLDHTLDAGIDLNWTIFDGFNISTTYKQLQELERQGATNTRIAIEDFIATLTAEYYNYIQQEIRLKNFRYADRPIRVRDSVIDLNRILDFDELWNATLNTNANLLHADQNTVLAQLDYKKVLSRNYPYLRLNAGYGYTFNKYDVNATRQRSNWGFSGGVTIGFNIFDGNRKREKRNASLAIRNAQLEREQVEQALRADLSNLWQAYRNNLRLLHLERENLIAAKENHEIAKERYLLGDLSGIEMREAQKSLLDAEERILSAEYDTKMCEISLLQLSGKVTVYLK